VSVQVVIRVILHNVKSNMYHVKTDKLTVKCNMKISVLVALVNMPLATTAPVIVGRHTNATVTTYVTKAIMTMALNVKLVNTVKSLKLNGYVLNVTLFKLLVLLVSKVSLTVVNATQQHIWKNMT
jgi:hypothetical protein